MGLDRSNDSLNAFPLIGILRLSSYHVETLKDIDYVVYPSPLYGEFSCALIQEQQALSLPSIDEQKPPAQLSQALLLAIVQTLHQLLSISKWKAII